MIYTTSVQLGKINLILETGRMAKQADGAVLVHYGDNIVLVTVVGAKEPDEDKGYFPLSVEYRERAYAKGKIPGGYLKREGKSTDKEILSARLIDRPIRPLFPEGYMCDVQVIANVLSSDQKYDADVLGIVGASAALCISDIPFLGPVAGVRVGRIDGNFIINPTFDEIDDSDMDIVVAGTEDSIMMVEGGSKEISEKDLLDALAFGHHSIKELVEMQKKMMAEIGKPKREFVPPVIDESLSQKVHQIAHEQIKTANRIPDKEQRETTIEEIAENTIEALKEEYPDSDKIIKQIIYAIEKEDMRKMIIEEGIRADGRKLDEIRPITCEVGILPRAHGSALFTRGQTQSLAVTTLGTKVDEQKVEDLEGESYKSYMLHYNFPPFCTGEIGVLKGPGRREIGHGHLAERSIEPVIPTEEKFPYTIRVVSDILESNGSSSMATVCGGTLSLMDAGVPIKSPVAGIAMGLVKEGDKFAILTDILGVEDHLGDMDFKVAGTRKGITGFQMDIKIKGISLEIMSTALEKAKTARMHVLDVMEKTLPAPRSQLSQYAPRIISTQIKPDKIGAVIGTGGKTIRSIQEETGATINIENDGTLTIAALSEEASEKALQKIRDLTEEVEVGKIYTGKVTRILNFGAFVEIMPNQEGLVHISQLDTSRVSRVEDVVNVGDEITVKVINIDEQGRINLSRKDLLQKKGRKY